MTCAGCAQRRAWLKRFFFGEEHHCTGKYEYNGKEWLSIESLDLDGGLAHVRLYGQTNMASRFTVQLPTERLTAPELQEYFVKSISPRDWRRASYRWDLDPHWGQLKKVLDTADPMSVGGTVYEEASLQEDPS